MNLLTTGYRYLQRMGVSLHILSHSGSWEFNESSTKPIEISGRVGTGNTLRPNMTFYVEYRVFQTVEWLA